jgi:hypothetical protein
MAANDTIFAMCGMVLPKTTVSQSNRVYYNRLAVCKKGFVIRKELIKLALQLQERQRGGAVALRFLAAGGSWQASRVLEEVRY